jgi:hypothetical protein
VNDTDLNETSRKAGTKVKATVVGSLLADNDKDIKFATPSGGERFYETSITTFMFSVAAGAASLLSFLVF